MRVNKSLVLVVEDDDSFRSALSLLLETAGWQVAEASDGRSGFRMAGDLGPEVIVTDLNMPRMSGIDLARALAARGGQRHRPMALTAAGPELMRVATESGLFERVMKKSASSSALIAAIRTVADSAPEE